MNNYSRVQLFQQKVMNTRSNELRRLSDKELEFFIDAFNEERDELVLSESVVDDVDALIDLIYFVKGALVTMGVTNEQYRRCFQTIHEANMRKELGLSLKRSGRITDAIKPEGWIAPKKQLELILEGK